MTDRKPTSIRLSGEADRLLDVLAAKLGIKRSAVMEQSIRKLAEQEGVRRDTPSTDISTRTARMFPENDPHTTRGGA